MGSTALELVFTDMRTDAVNGWTHADVAVGVEAHIRITDGPVVILDEADFEIVLLAQELDDWLATSSREDFVADLGTVRELPGAFQIEGTAKGWIVSSDQNGYTGVARDLYSVEFAIRLFIMEVRRQVTARGFDSGLSARQ